MAGSHIMVRCGFVCYCMFDWLVGFHNLILLVDFRLFDSWMDIYDFCGRLGIWNISMG